MSRRAWSYPIWAHKTGCRLASAKHGGKEIDAASVQAMPSNSQRSPCKPHSAPYRAPSLSRLVLSSLNPVCPCHAPAMRSLIMLRIRRPPAPAGSIPAPAHITREADGGTRLLSLVDAPVQFCTIFLRSLFNTPIPALYSTRGPAAATDTQIALDALYRPKTGLSGRLRPVRRRLR